MTFPTKTLDFFESFVDADGTTRIIYEGKLTVRRADVGVGLDRVVRREEFQLWFFAEHGIDNINVLNDKGNRRLAAEYITGINSYISCLSSTASIENSDRAEQKLSTDITFEEFKQLPEQLAVSWEQYVYALNPHWGLQVGDDDNQGEAKRSRGKRTSKKKSSTGSAPKA